LADYSPDETPQRWNIKTPFMPTSGEQKAVASPFTDNKESVAFTVSKSRSDSQRWDDRLQLTASISWHDISRFVCIEVE
jgi:hypothetical protein